MLKSLALAGALLCALFTASNAEARQRHRATGLHPMCGIQFGCEPMMNVSTVRERQRVARGSYVAWKMGIGGGAPKPHERVRVARKAVSYGVPSPSVAPTVAAVVAHPEGCPRSAFCGCGASVRIFGRSVRELWLAANWFKFPRAAPAPGMAAVRQHHVFVLEAHLGGDLWQVYDANSGGHQTRIHARRLAGYVIVNPRAG